MTEIREANFSLDLPGVWEGTDSSEPGTFAYGEAGGEGSVTVTLLAVRPMFAIADPRRMVGDYLHHRTKFERGQNPSLEQSEPAMRPDTEPPEGEWDALDVATGRRQRHRVVIAGSLLADFRFEASGLDDAAFDTLATAVLESASVAEG